MVESLEILEDATEDRAAVDEEGAGVVGRGVTAGESGEGAAAGLAAGGVAAGVDAGVLVMAAEAVSGGDGVVVGAVFVSVPS